MKKILAAFCLLVGFTARGSAVVFNHAIWDGILKANVDKDGYVDYDSIRISKGGDLYEYISFIEDASLAGLSDAEKTAFWINAYNAFVVQYVLSKPDLKKMNEDPAVFDAKHNVARIKLSLNDIEYRVLLSDPKRGGAANGYSVPVDPRVHFVLVKGALGSPELQNRAFSGATLQDRLQAAAKSFANDGRYLYLEDGTLHLSQIFDVSRDDFDIVGGVATYISKMIDRNVLPDGREILLKLESDYPDKTVFEYDWTLNHVRNRPKQ